MKTTQSDVVVGDSISALADGELRGEEFARALAACERDPTMLTSWRNYHLIGDVLRSPDLLAVRSDARFLSNLQSRLAQETIQSVMQTADLKSTTINPHSVTQVAANDALFRWKMVAGVASMAAVAVMVWKGVVPLSLTGSQLAHKQSSTDSVLVASPQGVIVRDARLEELLAAHKQVGGNSALQMPSGFLRNATFETSPHVRR